MDIEEASGHKLMNLPEGRILGCAMRNEITILDCDPGTDDALAMLCLSRLGRFPDVVIGSFGNAPCKITAANAWLMTRWLGENSKVAYGAEAPRLGGGVECGDFHGPDALAGLSDTLRSRFGEPQIDHGIDDVAEWIHEAGSVTYISTAPLTTLSLLLERGRFIAERLRHVYIMGGGIKTFNYDHNTEYNFAADPEAVRRVLSAGLTPVIFPLDFTQIYARVTQAEIAELAVGGVSWEVQRLLETNRASVRKYDGLDAAVIHDACPALYHVRPDVFSVARCCVAVDKWGRIDVVDKGGNPVLVAHGCPDNFVCKALKTVLDVCPADAELLPAIFPL